MRLGEVIKQKRKEMGFTLIHLSKLSGVSYGILFRIENNSIQNPHPDFLTKLAASLELDYVELMNISGHLKIKDEAKISIKNIVVYNFTDYEEAKNEQQLIKDSHQESIVLDKSLSGFNQFALVLDKQLNHPLCEKGMVMYLTEYHSLKQEMLMLCWLANEKKNFFSLATPIQDKIILRNCHIKSSDEELILDSKLIISRGVVFLKKFP